jgi:hypothetical protein
MLHDNLIHSNDADTSRIFDFLQTVFQKRGLYIILITNYGNIESALNPIWTLDASLIAAAFVYALVQVRNCLTNLICLYEHLFRDSLVIESRSYQNNMQSLSFVG